MAEPLAANGEYVLFFATPNSGSERLWLTRGTSSTTEAVANSGHVELWPVSAMTNGVLMGNQTPHFFDWRDRSLKPLSALAGVGWGYQNQQFGSILDHAGKLFLAGNSTEHGQELWVTDGTNAGTTRLTDIVPGPADSAPRNFVPMANGIGFTAVLDESRRRIGFWFSDGTVSGTTMLFETDSVEGAILSSFPVGYVDGQLYVAGTFAGQHGLFRADSPAYIPSLVKEFRRVQEGAIIGNLACVTALNDFSDLELWCSDGVSAWELADQLISPADLLNAGDFLYFTNHKNAPGSLWRTDGTPAGTQEMVGSRSEQFSFVTGSLAANSCSRSDGLYLVGHTATAHSELFLAAPGFDSLTQLTTLAPANDNAIYSTPVCADSGVYFPSNSIQFGRELFRYGESLTNDQDGDGVVDDVDAFLFDPRESVDTDGDGAGNNSDLDDDNDGVSDQNDAFPLNALEQKDTDSDGLGNNADTDDDGDGHPDSEDAYPYDPTRWQETTSTGGESGGGGGGSASYLALIVLLVLTTVRGIRRRYPNRYAR